MSDNAINVGARVVVHSCVDSDARPRAVADHLTMGRTIKMTIRVRRRPRLGGLLNFYERAA